MSYGVIHRCSLDAVLLWRKPADTALIWPLAWEPPYAKGVALKRQTQKTNKKKIASFYQELSFFIPSIK